MADDQKRIFKQKKLNTRLLDAVYSKNLDKVKTHLANEAHPDTQCQVSLVSSTHLAAYQGSVSILEELLRKDVDLTKRDIKGMQPHHLAAFKKESLPCLKAILDKRNDLIDSPVQRGQIETTLRPDVSDSYGHNHYVLTNLIREEIKEGATALYIATKNELTEVIKELLERNAMVTEEILDLAKNKEDVSILNTAYKKHTKTGELQEAVLKGNVEVVNQCLQKMGNTQIDPKTLHLAVHNKLKNKFNKNDYNDILVILVETERISINHLDENNKTPLYLATEHKWIDDIDWLITKNADETIQCRNGETIFHVAARNGDRDILKYLLKVKPNSNALKQLDNEGYTPLHRAIKSGNVDCVQALLETTDDNDYKLTLKEKKLTILHAAIESNRNQSEILQKILEFLMKTSSPASISVLNQTNSEGLTAVDLAAKNGEAKCLDVLFKYDNINAIPANIDKKKHYDTLLHHAAKKGFYKTLGIILPRCEDLIDMLDSNCLTALIYAARGGHRMFVETLLRRGANVAIKDPFVNRTAIDIIMSNVPGALEIMEAVLDSFIIPIKNTQIVEDTTENNSNDNNDSTTNQEQIPLLNSITNNEHNKINAINSSVSQVAIDMIESDALTTEYNVQDNSVVLKNSHQQTKVTTDIFKKNDNQQKHKILNTKQIPLNTTQQESPLTKNNNYNENYKIPMINLDYKFLVAGSRELEVIEAVNKCAHDKLKERFFLHPIVKTFLIYKWKSIKNLHLILLCVYLIHTLSVTGLAICSTIWQNFIAYLICFTLILLTIVPIILVEIVTWVLDAKIYSHFETYIKWFSIFLTGLFSVMTIFSQIISLFHRSFIIPHLGSVMVLFCWMKLLLFFSMRCNGGFYIILFFKIASRIFQVLCLFFFLTIGFALSFFILFSGREPFPDPLSSFGAVMAMISEIKYDEAFEKETDLVLIILGHILFNMFYILVVMIMMNLIIGFSVNIVTEHEGKYKHFAMQSSFLSLVDKFCWDDETNKFIKWLREFLEKFNHLWTNKQTKKEKIKLLTIHPNQSSKDNIFGKEIIAEVMEKVMDKTKPSRLAHMTQKLSKVENKVDEVLDMVDNNRK